jgi:hypothetical protein
VILPCIVGISVTEETCHVRHHSSKKAIFVITTVTASYLILYLTCRMENYHSVRFDVLTPAVVNSGGLGLKILVARRQRGPTHNYKAII